MKQLLTWHTLDEKEPPEKHHLLVELDDYSMVSGNMTPENESFVADRSCALYWRDEILRWCEYPEEPVEDETNYDTPMFTPHRLMVKVETYRYYAREYAKCWEESGSEIDKARYQAKYAAYTDAADELEQIVEEESKWQRKKLQK